jgi:uncharacterized protein involved in outer membrane biogenesis
MPDDSFPPGRLAQARRRLHLQGWRLWILVAILVYTLVGFLGLPWLARHQAPGLARDMLGIELAIDRVRFNPYVFRLGVEGLSAQDPQTGPLLEFERLVVDFELASAWQRAWTFREISLAGAHARLLRLADGRSNIGIVLDRLPPAAAAAEPESAEPPRLIVQALTLEAGRLDLRDESRPTPWSRALGPITLSMDDFTTLAEREGRYQLTARTDRGGQLGWQGTLAVNPLRSAGELTLADIQLAPLWDYLKDDFDGALDAGRLALRLDYALDASAPALALRVMRGSMELTGLEMLRQSTGDRLLSLPQLSISETGFDLETMRLVIGAVDVTAPDLALRLLEDGRVDLEAALAPRDAATGADEPADATDSPREPELAIELAALRIAGGRVSFEDRTAPGPVQVALEDLELAVTDYQSNAGHRAELELSATLAGGGRLSLGGSARGVPLDVALDVDAEAVSLLPFLPYLEAALPGLEIDSLAAGARGAIILSEEEPFAFTGTARLDDMVSRLADQPDPALRLANLEAEGMDLSFARNELRVARARLSGAFARILIDEQGVLNLASITGEAATPDDAAEAPEPAAAPEPMAIGIGRIEIADGEMDFSDRNLPLPFRALVQSMRGSVSAVTSGSATPARVEIDGNVLPHGATTIRGTLDVFDPMRVMDLDVDFRNIEMHTLTPYSVRFAGRAITSGRLDVDLGWSIRDGQLEASNRLVIRELQLGERVDAPGAMRLPLDLAVALLTDRNGHIDLDVPVTGDVNNPEFRYAALVFRALGNLLGRIATAPFRFLASLVGGDAADTDLEFVGFVAGDAALLGPEAEDLSQLAQALAERPELKLEVGAAFDVESDGAAIRSRRLDDEVSRRFEAGEQRGGEGDPVQLILEAMYEEAAGDGATAELKARFTTPAPEPQQPPALDDAGYLLALRAALIALQPLADGELAALGRARAEAVLDHLVGIAGLDERRIGLGEPGAADKTDANLVYLRLGVSVD